MKKEELDDHILEGLIGIGYDLHIHDLSGKYPGGLDREDYESKRINELFAPQLGRDNEVENEPTDSDGSETVPCCVEVRHAVYKDDGMKNCPACNISLR